MNPTNYPLRYHNDDSACWLSINPQIAGHPTSELIVIWSRRPVTDAWLSNIVLPFITHNNQWTQHPMLKCIILSGTHGSLEGTDPEDPGMRVRDFYNEDLETIKQQPPDVRDRIILKDLGKGKSVEANRVFVHNSLNFNVGFLVLSFCYGDKSVSNLLTIDTAKANII